jgi:putative cell wall-binding protein
MLMATTPVAGGADAGCLPDPSGDTRGDLAADRGDLLSSCVDWHDGLTVLFTTARQLTPEQMTGDTLVLTAYLGDPEFSEHILTARLTASGIAAEIVQYEYDFEGTSDDFVREVGRCPVPARISSAYVIGPTPPGCAGEAEELDLSLFVDYSIGTPYEDPTATDRFPAEYPDTAFVARYGGTPSGRIAGASRIETAALIAQTAFGGSARSVYLARADEFADAVAAGSLTDGPILLVPSCGDVPSAVREQIDRIEPERVVALGGESAVCGALLEAAAAGRRSERIAGESRIATAAAVALTAFPEGAEEVYLARADTPVDAIAGGVLTRGPVLLVPPCGPVPDAVQEAVVQLSPRSAIGLGGPGALCDQVIEDIDPAGGRQRLAGSSRELTAIAISQYEFPDGRAVGPVFLARSDQFADAVAAGSLPLAPILLTPSCDVPPDELLAEVQRLAPESLVALGGQSAVCDFVVHYAGAF